MSDLSGCPHRRRCCRAQTGTRDMQDHEDLRYIGEVLNNADQRLGNNQDQQNMQALLYGSGCSDRIKAERQTDDQGQIADQ